MPSAMGLPAVLFDTQDVFGNTEFFGESRLDQKFIAPGDCSRYMTNSGAWCYVEIGTVFRLSKLSAVFTMLEESRRKEISSILERSTISLEMFNGKELFTIPANELYSRIEAFKTLEYSINPLITFAAMSVFKVKLKTPKIDESSLWKSFSMRILLTGWKIDYEAYLQRKIPTNVQQ